MRSSKVWRRGGRPARQPLTDNKVIWSVFGSRGDFVTAPEVSPLFGDCLAVWCVSEWLRLGR